MAVGLELAMLPADAWGSSRSSVKSGAAAIPTRARTRSGRASASSSMIQPPMLEPTTTWGPRVIRSTTASASAHQAPIVPSAKRPVDAPWPR